MNQPKPMFEKLDTAIPIPDSPVEILNDDIDGKGYSGQLKLDKPLKKNQRLEKRDGVWGIATYPDEKDIFSGVEY